MAKRARQRGAAAGLTAAGATVPGAAAAHAPAEGLEGVQAGALHLLSEPPTLLCLIALGVIYGQAPGRRALLLWGMFAAAFASGVAVRATTFPPPLLDAWLLGAALAAAAGAALAAGARVGAAALILGGAAVGAASWPDAGPPGAVAATVAGSAVTAGLAVLYIGAGLRAAQARWPARWLPIAARIAAAWVAAVSTLLLALALAPAPPA